MRYVEEQYVPKCITGFYAKTHECDACKRWVDEDYLIFFYKVADMYICEDCHDDYVAGMDAVRNSNS